MIKFILFVVVAAFIYGVVFLDGDNKVQVNEAKKEKVVQQYNIIKDKVKVEFDKVKTELKDSQNK
jgi:hypothetical protein